MLEIIWVLTICYLCLFILSLKIKDNSIVDVFWGTWFVLVSLMLFFWKNIINIYEIIFIIFFSVWWLRLTYYIWKRKLKSHREDPRYAKWRESWKYFKTRSFFQVYILQGILLLIISTPIFIIFSKNIWLNLYTVLWLIWMIIWIIYETIADIQVKAYIKNTQKAWYIFTGGLYKYSRHPNYLWESIFWLWVSIISLQVNMLGIIGFLVITWLLLFVSGVPLKEERYKTKKNWQEYSQNTPKFIPNYFK